MTTNINIGLKIKTIRQLRGVVQFELARRLAVSRATYSYIENGHNQPTPEQQALIENFFGLQLNDPQVDAAFAVLANTEADRAAVLGALNLLERPGE